MRKTSLVLLTSVLLMFHLGAAFAEEEATPAQPAKTKVKNADVELALQEAVIFQFRGEFGENDLLVKNLAFPGGALLGQTLEGGQVTIPLASLLHAEQRGAGGGDREKKYEFRYLIVSGMSAPFYRAVNLYFPEDWEQFQGYRASGGYGGGHGGDVDAKIISDLDQAITGEVEALGQISVPLRNFVALRPISFRGELVSLPGDEMEIDLGEGLGVMKLPGLQELAYYTKDWPGPGACSLTFWDGQHVTGKIVNWPEEPIVIRTAEGELKTFRLEQVGFLTLSFPPPTLAASQTPPAESGKEQ